MSKRICGRIKLRWPWVAMTTSLVMFALPMIEARPVFAQDEPDLKKEKRLHRIYEKYNAEPTSPQKWTEALAKAKDQTYTIQKGDTLWGISETFFADPHFWPKVWSLNQEIYNPHEIKPKNVVVFTPGTGAEPPGLAVQPPGGTAPNPAPSEGGLAATEGEPVGMEGTSASVPGGTENGDPGIILNKQVGQFIDIDLTQVKIPPPRRKDRPARNLPPSMPPRLPKMEVEKTIEVLVEPIRRNENPQPYIISHIASDQVLTPMGEVVGGELGLSAVSDGQEILVKGKGLSPGSRVLVMRPLGKVAGLKNVLNYAINGQIDIENVVNSRDGILRARMVKSVGLVQPGDILVGEDLPTVAINSVGSMSPIAGKIIGGQFSSERDVLAPFDVVYLNAGSAQGVSVGTHLPVYRNPSSRIAKSLIRENPAEIGELQVVRVSGGVATAVIVRQIDDIRVGDVTSPVIE